MDMKKCVKSLSKQVRYRYNVSRRVPVGCMCARKTPTSSWGSNDCMEVMYMAKKRATRKKATRKKATRKKATAKKATRKKATRKKATRKKATAKKTTRKKTARR